MFKTMTFFAQVLRPGEKTRPVRQTAILLVAPFEGKVNWELRNPITDFAGCCARAASGHGR